MQVNITGRSIEDFIVTVNGEQFNIQNMLRIEESTLIEEIENCAAEAHFWSQIAIDAQHQLDEFEHITYAQYQAHLDKYSRYYLKAAGEKTFTNTAKDRTAALIFSPGDYATHASIAWKGYSEECKKIGITCMSIADFKNAMYVWEQNFEEMESIILALRYKANQLKAVASAFETKSWNVKVRAADKRALMTSNL